MTEIPEMIDPPECAACCCPMDKGFLLDHAHAELLQIRWRAGDPDPGWFSEVKLKNFRTGMKVDTYRCPECGRLESFALGEDAPG